MCAGGEHTKGLDTGKGLVRTFIYMNNTTTPNMSFHHLTSIFATTAGRLVVPMRSLVTKFIAVAAIFLLASTVLAPSAFAGPHDEVEYLCDPGTSLEIVVTGSHLKATDGNWEQTMFHHGGVRHDGNFQVQLATDPGEDTTVDLSLVLGKPGSLAFLKLVVDADSETFTESLIHDLTFTPGPDGNWNIPQTVPLEHLDNGWNSKPACITLTVNDTNTTIDVIHVHDTPSPTPPDADVAAQAAADQATA